jgi:hypothetical protein
MTPGISTRDRGLALISRFNRWLLAVAVATSGFISVAAARAFHGHVSSGTGSSSIARSAPLHSQSSSGQDGSAGGLQQPAQAPAPAQSAPSPVVSGGS